MFDKIWARRTFKAAIIFVSTIAVAGVSTFTGAIVAAAATFSGTVGFTGLTTGVRREALISLTDDTLTLTAAQAGLVVFATKATGTQVFTLPAASAVPGAEYTFICGHAGGEINVDPDGTDDMMIKATEDSGASVLLTDGTGIQNTAGTNIIGDHITLISDGVGRWYMKGQSGIWATQ